ncbi:winged helix-turn-helix transcriptional regulator [Metabacillus rhizolycopersici]|uniref:MarR family transcriptional regulator n=1 Tax=Metabacillus rhizolycopersici TaxID=2875709 RepID=A0ABS7V0N6_9BACI|nr:winged helix-turn-helix transcriptional regulator [Metabacillus rhizolycopersici]MBZ5753752.1 MarR family transcriptional regulator [Metabacillus rhizolycopersici]
MQDKSHELKEDIFIEVPDENGEIHQYILTPTKRKKVPKGDWIMAFQESLLHLAKANLSGETSRVLFFLMYKLDYENWLRISQISIADELGLKKQQVNRSIKQLIEKGIIVKGPKVGNSLTYRLDPAFAFKGQDRNIKKVRKEVDHLKRIK